MIGCPSVVTQYYMRHMINILITYLYYEQDDLVDFELVVEFVMVISLNVYLVEVMYIPGVCHSVTHQDYNFDIKSLLYHYTLQLYHYEYRHYVDR